MTRRWRLWLVTALMALAPAAAARADGPPKLVKDLLPGQNSGSPHDLTAYKGAIYFTGADAGGFGLWRGDGTDVTLFQRTNSGAGFTVAGDSLYFAAEDAANGLELWRSDGGAPALVKDLEPGTGGSGPHSLTAVGALVYFEAVTTAGGRALWRSDGTAAGTVQLKSFVANQGLSSLTAVGSLLFFVANDGTHGRELWRSDGTPAGTFMVRDIDPTGPSAPSMLTPFGAQLVFAATDPDHGTELWRSDGTTATLIADVWPGVGHNANPQYAAVLGDSLYFAAEDARGRELWRTDGTGATFVADIDPGAESSDPRWITAVGGTLLFEARDATHGRELWRSDGTTAALVRDINPGGGDGHVQPTGDGPLQHLAVAGGRAFFQADDGTTGVELWRSDGTSAARMSDIYPGDRGAQPEEMTAVGNRLFFAAGHPDSGTELWSLELGPEADLAVTLTGELTKLTVTVRNLGPEATTGVRVRVPLPAGVTLNSAPPGYAGDEWTVGTLASGAVATLELSVTVTGATPTVTAQVSGNALTDPFIDNNRASVVLAGPGIHVGGTCTLMRAIEAANTDAPSGGCPAGHGADTITLTPTAHQVTAVYETVDGATGLPSITSDITIAGNGGTILRPGGPAFRLFRVPVGGALTLRNVTLSGGSSPVRGGDLLVAGGSVTLEDARVDGAISPEGGGLAVSSGDLTLTRTTVTGNTALYGGGIYTAGGTLTLVDSTVSGNQASGAGVITFGGGMFVTGALSITRGTISGNHADDGGGIMTLGVAAFTDVTVDANTASFGFGGIDSRGPLTMLRGRVMNNVAGGTGGGLGHGFSGVGALHMTGTTVSGNRALDGGAITSYGEATLEEMSIKANTTTGGSSGALRNLAGAQLTLDRSTLNGNAGGGLVNEGTAAITTSTFSANAINNAAGTLALVSSTIVGAELRNGATASVTGSIVPQCVGAFTDGGGNTGCGVDPQLGPLADNGGPTLTHAPLPGSPAIDAAAACPASDQRGTARPLDGNGDGVARCDAGAVEAPAAAPVALPGAPAPAAPVLPKPAPLLSKPATGISGLPTKLTVKGGTLTLGTAKNPPTAATTQTLTSVAGKAARTVVVARGTTRIPAGGKRPLTVKLTPAGKRALKRGPLKVRLKIVATGPDGARATITRTVTMKRKK